MAGPSRATAERLALRHTVTAAARAEHAGQLASRAFLQLGGLDDASKVRWLATIVTPMLGADQAAWTGGSAYGRLMARLFAAAVGPVPGFPGTPKAYRERWHGPVIAARATASKGGSYEEAMTSGAGRAHELGRTGYAEANREGARVTMEATEGVTHYRRVPEPGACEFCRTIATRRYFVGDLAPAHANCGCGVMPAFD